MIYFTMLSVSIPAHISSNVRTSDDLQWIRKETVVAQSRYYPGMSIFMLFMRATESVHLIVLDLVSLIICGEKYKLKLSMFAQ
jgi:hypothetical protein